MKKSTEVRPVFRVLGIAAAFLLILNFTLQSAPGFVSATLEPAEKAVAQVSGEIRDDLSLALGLLEKCFGHPVDLEEVRTLDVTLTAYTSSVLECDSTPHITASQKPVRRGIIAVSHDLYKEIGLKFGQKVLIPGHGIFEVQDRMHRRWKRTVDIWYDDYKAAKLFGRQNGTIMWIPAGAEKNEAPLVASK